MMRVMLMLLMLPGAVLAQPVADYADFQARRRALLGHTLPQHAPTDGRARPRQASAYDIRRVSMRLEVPDGRILPRTGDMDVEIRLERGLNILPLLAFFFEPLEITLGGRPLDFMRDPGSGEMLVFFPDTIDPGDITLQMRVNFDGYCQDPTGCIENERQQHLAQFGWYPLNAEVGPDDYFNVRLDLTLADGRVPGGTGNRTEIGRDGRQVQWRFETTRETILPALALGPNRAQPRGLVQVDVPPRTVDDGGFIAEIVEDTIRFYAELLGPYPFDRLGVSPISDNAGVGLGPQANIFLPESFWLIPPDALEAELVAQVTSHEVAHQYFFNLVHIIDNGEGWMSEAFAEYAATRFSQARTGTLDHALGNYWDYVLGVPPGQDAAINSEEVDLRPGDIRQRIIYFKGSALLHQIGQRLPDFDDHLRAYVAAFSEEIVTTRDFIDFMDDVSDSNIGALIRQWTQRPGLPYLQVTVQRPRDGSDELTVSVVQTQDGRRFDAAVPWVAEFEDGSTARVDVAINLPVDSTLDVGRAQSNTIDPDLSIFRRVVAEPAGDINLSGVVDGMDLLDSLSNQGLAAPTPQWNDIQDVNRDLVIDANDTRAILRSWGAGW